MKKIFSLLLLIAVSNVAFSQNVLKRLMKPADVFRFKVLMIYRFRQKETGLRIHYLLSIL